MRTDAGVQAVRDVVECWGGAEEVVVEGAGEPARDELWRRRSHEGGLVHELEWNPARIDLRWPVAQAGVEVTYTNTLFLARGHGCTSAIANAERAVECMAASGWHWRRRRRSQEVGGNGGQSTHDLKRNPARLDLRCRRRLRRAVARAAREVNTWELAKLRAASGASAVAGSQREGHAA